MYNRFSARVANEFLINPMDTTEMNNYRIWTLLAVSSIFIPVNLIDPLHFTINVNTQKQLRTLQEFSKTHNEQIESVQSEQRDTDTSVYVLDNSFAISAIT